MTKEGLAGVRYSGLFSFGFRHSSFFRHSDFVIRHFI